MLLSNISGTLNIAHLPVTFIIYWTFRVHTRTATVYSVFFCCNCFYYIWIQIVILFFAAYFPLNSCVTCEFLPRGVIKGTSYLILKILLWSLHMLKDPYYTVFHQFHTAVRGPTTLYSICIAPNPSLVLNFSCLKVALQSSIQSSLFLCLHL